MKDISKIHVIAYPLLITLVLVLMSLIGERTATIEKLISNGGTFKRVEEAQCQKHLETVLSKFDGKKVVFVVANKQRFRCELVSPSKKVEK